MFYCYEDNKIFLERRFQVAGGLWVEASVDNMKFRHPKTPFKV